MCIRDRSYGFLTRGCPNRCKWCVVPKKEGKISPYMDIEEITAGDVYKRQPIYLSRSEVCNISTFPQDYHFLNQSPHYICGMSVPPVMMAQVADVYKRQHKD